MKFPLSIILALASVSSVLGQSDVQTDAVCQADADFVNQNLVNQPYNEQVQTELHSTTIRVIHPGDVITTDFVPSRLNIKVDDNDNIQSAGCY